jgi:hypothetical protein
MSQVGRRSFAVALLVLVGLTTLALIGRAGGETSDGPLDQRRLDGVRTALMPLLQYVREGQPRDALKELSAATGSTVDPAAFRTIRDDATTALANLEHLGQTPASIRAATSLYAEAAGLAEDASRGPQARRVELAAIGSRLLRYADALFDHARRVSGEGLPASAIRLDSPAVETPKELASRVRAESDHLAKVDRDRAGRLRAIARTILRTDEGR